MPKKPTRIGNIKRSGISLTYSWSLSCLSLRLAAQPLRYSTYRSAALMGHIIDWDGLQQPAMQFVIPSSDRKNHARNPCLDLPKPTTYALTFPTIVLHLYLGLSRIARAQSSRNNKTDTSHETGLLGSVTKRTICTLYGLDWTCTLLASPYSNRIINLSPTPSAGQKGGFPDLA